MPKDELELNADQLEAKAFDDAWNDDAPDTDDFEDDTDDDTSDQEAVEDDIDEDSTDELEEEGDEDESDDQGEEEPEETDDNVEQSTEDKEAQRLKSWEGRLKADDARLKKEREELLRKSTEGKQREGDESNDEQDTGNSPDAFEEEFPEVADYLNKHIQPLREQLSKSQLEQQQKAQEAHVNRITASHPDAITVVGSEGFQSWIDDQPYKAAKEYVHVQQNGTPEQVVAMLDDFKKHKSESTKPAPTKQPSSVVKTRRTAKPKGRVSKNDFDGAWEEANSK
jgi:hypothetical protein